MWRKMMASRIKEAFVVMFMVAGVFAGVTALSAPTVVKAAEGCRLASNWPSDKSTRGQAILEAPTTNSNVDTDCTGYSVNTEIWIEDATSIICLLGQQSGTVCYKWDDVHAVAKGGVLSYGLRTGWSKHWQIRPDTSWWLSGELQTTLNAGDADNGQPGDEDPPLAPGECPLDEPDCGASPILVPLTRSQSHKLTSVEEGVQFDHNGDGILERTAWTAADSKLAFLAYDRNGNGRIDNGTELFGDNTLPGAHNGFMALRMLNQQSGGTKASVSSDDPLFAKLLLWEDANHNGVSEPYELQPVAPMLSQISLWYEEHNRKDGHGNQFRYRGGAHIRTKAGRNQVENPADNMERLIHIYDVIFKVQK
jgi:hypothetical protein